MVNYDPDKRVKPKAALASQFFDALVDDTLSINEREVSFIFKFTEDEKKLLGTEISKICAALMFD